MSELEQLRRLADQVSPPPFDSISAAAARRRNRRSAVTAATLALTAAGLVVAGAIVVFGDGSGTTEPVRPPPGSPAPSRPEESNPPKNPEPRSLESMTPEEVVNDPDAELEAVAMAPGDPDVRISMWRALCTWCPDRPDGRGGSLGPPTFTGMAVTSDGYATATYVRHPFSGLGGDILSPRDDMFLFVDMGNGREWLIDLDGTVRRVERSTAELRPTDPRLWFECGRAGGWTSTWCSLDPDTATAYVWPEEWNRSATPPFSGEQPWGWSPIGAGSFEDPGGVVEAWWDDNGTRHRRALATDAMGGVVHESADGDLAYWTWQLGDNTVDLHTSRDRGASWDVNTRPAPGFNRWVQMTRSPDGALLAWTYYPHLVVWRADVSGGGFRRVLEAPGPDLEGAGLLTQDGLVYANGSGVSAVSEDGGLTWSTIQTWR